MRLAVELAPYNTEDRRPLRPKSFEMVTAGRQAQRRLSTNKID